MREAVIVEAVRTPVGRRNGTLKDVHAVDLAAEALKALVERAGIDPALVEDVIMGCVSQVGEQGMNIARSAALAAGFPESVTGVTIDRQCGSSQQAVQFAAQAIMAGTNDIVIAAGVESMSRVPMGVSFMHGPGKPFGSKMMARYDNFQFNQGIGAEMIAERWGFDRAAIDAFSLESHQRALAAQQSGHFDREIVPVQVTTEDGQTVTLAKDEGPRADTSLDKLGTLKTPFKEDGVISAGSSSQISDGAAALLIMERSVAEKLGLKPRARFVTFAMAGDDPKIMLTAPIPATKKALEKSGLTLDQIDHVEINEAFAPVVAAWYRELNPDMDRVNVNGGAMAIGHPLGSTGARLLTTLLHEMERSDKQIGFVTMCCGGGLGTGTLIERV